MDIDLSYLHTHYKQLFDNIHRYIKISNYATVIINTPSFQRLRELHQLGTCHYVFPTASKSRFEHSIGTYYLAGRILHHIKLRTDTHKLNKWISEMPELKHHIKKKQYGEAYLDEYLIELIKIAALCHDLGHGPFSHVFDDIVIPQLIEQGQIEPDNPNIHHEARSAFILRHIIKTTPLKDIIDDDDINFMAGIINPTPDKIGFLYQIVSNNLNGLDVDKYDYIVRDSNGIGIEFSIDYSRLIDDVCVIDNIVCYPQQVYIDILNLFTTRYRLHKQVYVHKTVVSIQHMICEIILSLSDILKIKDSLMNVDLFNQLTDNHILSLARSAKIHHDIYSDDVIPNLLKANNIVSKIDIRDIYKHIKTFVAKRNINVEIGEKFSKYSDDIYIFTTKIGFVSGDKPNPMNDIYFYNTKDKITDRKAIQIGQADVTNFFPMTHQEYICMIFVKDRSNKKLIEDLTARCSELMSSDFF